MSKLHLAAWAMLLAALPALSSGARAAPGFPHAIVAAAPTHDYRLVQYGGGGGGGGGGCDDDCPRPHPQHRNGGGDGGAAAIGAIIGIIGEAARQHQLEENRKRQLQNQQNLLNQQRQRAIDDQNRRNRANQDERNRRARQEELDRNRRQQEAERERLKKLEQQREQEAQRVNEQKAADEQYKKQEDAVHQEEEEQKQRDQAYNNEPYEPGEKIEDKLENNVTIQIIVVPHDDRPDLDTVPPLYVNKNTQLPACGYVTMPANREICSGRTASGGWLRSVSVPTAGGTRSVCVSFCPPANRPKIPDKRPKVVERHDPAPGPTYVTPPPYQPVVPPPYQPPVVKPKPVTPAFETASSDSYVEPPPRRPLTPAFETAWSDSYVEPPPRRPLTPAFETAASDPYVEPAPRRPLTPAFETAASDPYVEPAPRRPLTPAFETAASDPYVEPAPRRPLTPAVDTVMADAYVEPEPKRKLTPAVDTGEASPYVEPAPKAERKHGEREPLTPAVETASADLYIQPASHRPPVTPAALTGAASSFTQPDPKRPQPKSEVPAVALDAIDADKPDQPETRQAKLDGGQLDEATPTSPPDSKGCTDAGVRPLTAAMSEPLAKFNSPAFSPREVVTTVISGIPAVDGIPVGGILSAVTKAFWKDGSSEKLFDAMKSYVDQVVPAAIAKYDTTQLNNDLTTIHKRMSEYDHTRTLSTKGQVLSRLVDRLDDMQPRFLNPQSPKSTLAEFVAFGALHLAALQELYDNYDQYYPFDPKAASDHQVDRSAVKSKLNDAIKDYKDHIQALRNDIIADRLGKLRVNDRGDVHSVFWSVDAPDVLVTNDYFSAKDDFCDWQGPEHKDDQFSSWRDLASRQAAVRAAYDKLIDELTAPIARWKPI